MADLQASHSIAILADDGVMKFSGSRRDLIPPHKHAADMQTFLGTNAMGFPKV
jgi:hypothetical protein